MDLQITGLEEQAVAQAAAVKFPDKYIEMGESDLYLPDIEKGSLTIAGIDHPVYASTHYAYEDKMVNGNKTRYKIPLSIIYTKQDAYEIIYDSRDICYVAYEQENAIQFVLYEDFYDFIKDQITICEKK